MILFYDLYEKFGWVIKPESYLDSYEYDKLPPPGGISIPDKKQGLVSSACNVATVYHMLGRTKEARKFARETTRAALDFFYGDWRRQGVTRLGTVDPVYWEIHRGWIDAFRESLCWATAVGDWEAAAKLAAYPSGKCKINISYTKQDVALYLALAELIHRRSLDDLNRYLLEAEDGKKEKPKLLARVVRALHARDNPRFQRALEKYLLYFKRSEFRRFLDRLLCFDGTTLMNLGRRAGLKFDVPPPVNDHMIQL